MLTHLTQQLGSQMLLLEEFEHLRRPIVRRRVVRGPGEAGRARPVPDLARHVRIRELGELASALAAAAGHQLPLGSFPSFASSDHVTLSRAGVPALTVHSGDDDFIHRPEDDLANVSVEDLGAMLEAAAAIVRGLLISE